MGLVGTGASVPLCQGELDANVSAGMLGWVCEVVPMIVTGSDLYSLFGPRQSSERSAHA